MFEFISFSEFAKSFVIMWAVIDPIGTVPVFLEATKNIDAKHKKTIATKAVLIAGAILMFFLVGGQIILELMSISLPAFQISGGIVLFLFALTMIFGHGKPEEEINMIKDYNHIIVFPIATPSIASPGAMMAIVLLTDNHRYSVFQQSQTALIMILVLFLTWLLLGLAQRIQQRIGETGITVISKIMGLLLTSIAVESILTGIKNYFNL